MSNNILLSMYRNKVKSILNTVYNGKINDAFLDKYLDKICENAEKKIVNVNVRNLYQYDYGHQIPVNQVLEDIRSEHLNIHANGTYTENIKPINYFVIDDLSDLRKLYKDRMFEAKVIGDEFGVL